MVALYWLLLVLGQFLNIALFVTKKLKMGKKVVYHTKVCL